MCRCGQCRFRASWCPAVSPVRQTHLPSSCVFSFLVDVVFPGGCTDWLGRHEDVAWSRGEITLYILLTAVACTAPPPPPLPLPFARFRSCFYILGFVQFSSTSEVELLLPFASRRCVARYDRISVTAISAGRTRVTESLSLVGVLYSRSYFNLVFARDVTCCAVGCVAWTAT